MNRKPLFTISHIAFSILFPSVLYLIANAVNLHKISKWFVLNQQIDYSGLIAFLIFGLCFFIAFFVLLAHRWTLKPAAYLFILLSAASSYFIAKYNVAIESTMMMNVFYTDRTESLGLLSFQMLPYFIFLVLLPVLLLNKIKVTFRPALAYLSQSLLLFILSLALGVGLVYLEYNSIHRAGNQSKKYIGYQLVPDNLIVGLGAILQDPIEDYFKKHKKPVIITGSRKSDDNLIVVLAIGESSRQKNFSLYGYPKNTNPLLSKRKGLHHLNGIARLGSTLYALPEILEKNDVKLATITQKLGVETSCLVNYTMYDNCEAVGEIEVNHCGHNGKCYDEDTIPLLADKLKTYTKGPRLIIVHIGAGSHGPTYKDRYPPEFQQFNPQCLKADIVNQCTKEELYNSYDNTILSIDFVLNKMLDTLDRAAHPYVFMYLSDHGESLLEEGRIFHGMPPGISLPAEQAQVPLLVSASVPISIAKRQEYRQPDVFDTILDLFAIDSPVLDKTRVFIKRNTP